MHEPDLEISTLPEGQKLHLARKARRVEELRTQISESVCESRPLCLEIGCGHGHFLTNFAQHHPELNCVGVDLVTKRIEKACAKRNKRDLANLHFFKAEITEFLQALPDMHPLHSAFILFPDPWPKKRHRKNRILQLSLLDAIASRSLAGITQLHFRTDHPGAFDWGMEVIASHPDWTIDDELLWPFESGSFFQDMMDSYSSLSAVFKPKPVDEHHS